MSTNTSPDFLQRTWAKPEPFEIFRNDTVIITPDIKPAKPGQLLVVHRLPSWERMTAADVALFYVIGEEVCRELEQAYHPQRGTALTRFGNDSPTPHLICYPRDEVTDGVLLHDKLRPKATNEELATTQQIMREQFEKSGFVERIQGLGAVGSDRRGFKTGVMFGILCVMPA